MKRNNLFTLRIFSVFFLTIAAVTNAAAQQGLAANWKGENNFRDTRGVAEAVPHNSPSFAPGNVGSAFSFQSQAYLTVPFIPRFPVTATSRDRLDLYDFTIEGWIKPSAIGGRQYIVAKTLAADQTAFGDVFALYLQDGQLVGGVRQPFNVFRSIASAPNAIQADNWYHVAYTYDFQTQTQRLFLNAVEVSSLSSSFVSYASETSTFDLTIAAARNTNTGQAENYFNGLIDEISLYHRDLEVAEITDIYSAGTQGKKSVGAEPPPDLLGWWKMDGNIFDISGNNNHGVAPNAVYSPGFVGTALFTNLNNSNNFALPSSINPANITVEAWVNIGFAFERIYILRKPLSGSSNDALSLYIENGNLFGQIGNAANTYTTTFYGGNMFDFGNKWRHVALTFDDATNLLQVFIDGRNVSFRSVPISISYDNSPWQFHSNPQPTSVMIDEISIYSRAFPTSPGGENEELRSIYFAGRNGKQWSQTTLVGMSQLLDFNQLTVRFSETTSSGRTSVTPLDPQTLDTPGNFDIGVAAFEISTTAGFTGDIELCFFLTNWDPSDPTGFAELKVLHREAGVWVDRTTLNDFPARTLCGTVTSLSPFVIAQELAPTAANVEVAGRVLTADGRGISKARVFITDKSGETRSTMTNPFGFYRFNEIPVGATYVVSVRHKRFQFSPQILTVKEAVAEFNFIAESTDFKR